MSLNVNKKGIMPYTYVQCMFRLEKLQELTQFSPRSHSRHLVGKRTALK